uniref:Putative acetyltransferase (GNAT) family protein n=1 Tax=uncultured marine crenarchaeote HF4000_APKG6D9 TaxID=455597 RepID=B3T950_9ARCH|nr:putative acetyltransferase (GNAT) family protein [uncultured marine crenarchaeote HF4000_APKG6D9]
MVGSSKKIMIDETAFDFPQIDSQPTPCLDCTNDKGEDSQFLQNFIDKRALKNQKAHLGTTYCINYKNKTIGYVTLASANIHKDEIISKKRAATRDGPLFPSMIILDFCIDKKLRGKGFGKYVLMWCNGLARIVSEKIGCRYIVLFTKDAINFYKKYNYRVAETPKKGDFTLMYVDVFPELRK